VGNRRGLRLDRCVGSREDMARGGSGRGAEDSVWEGIPWIRRESALLRTSDATNRCPPWLGAAVSLLPMWAPDRRKERPRWAGYGRR